MNSRPFRVLPVLDLQHGLVVRGISGRRTEYRPIQSRLCADARPATVGRAFVEQFGLSEAYVADLDAIAGAEPAWDIYAALTACGLRLIVDAGPSDTRLVQSLSQFSWEGISLLGIVAGLESLPSLPALGEWNSLLPSGKLWFSLDLQQGRPLTSRPELAQRSPRELAAAAVAQGIEHVIVLDLAQVGTDRGPATLELCRAIRAQFPNLDLISGGGTRSVADLESLAGAGCSGILVASALHDGHLQPADLPRDPTNSRGP